MKYMSAAVTLVSAVALAGFTADRALAQQDVGTLTVQNNRDVPVTVYAEATLGDAGPLREMRIGTVAPMETERIQIPAWAAGENTVQAFLHVEGGEDLATEEFPVGPGVDIGTIVTTPSVGEVRGLPQTPPRQGDAAVRVQNNRAVPVTVLVRESRPALGPPMDTRLAVVPPESAVDIPLPDWVASLEEEVRFILHPEGAADLTSEPVSLVEGSTPELLVPKG